MQSLKALVGRRLLLVEDSEPIRHLLSRAFQSYGLIVKVAENGDSALELIKSFRPELAIIDIGLPDTDGYSLAREIRALSESSFTSLVALTGYAHISEHELARQAGFDRLIFKPVDPEELAYCLAELMLKAQ